MIGYERSSIVITILLCTHNSSSSCSRVEVDPHLRYCHCYIRQYSIKILNPKVDNVFLVEILFSVAIGSEIYIITRTSELRI